MTSGEVYLMVEIDGELRLCRDLEDCLRNFMMVVVVGQLVRGVLYL